MYASHDNTLIKTILGSCVSISVWDQKKKSRGMNHYIYPTRDGKERSTKFGDVACPYLLKLMQDLGSNIADLVINVVGGASSPVINSDIGESNIQIAQKVLDRYSLSIGIWDVGGVMGRKVLFNTATGKCISYITKQGGQQS